MNDTEIRTELADSDNVVRYVKPKSVLSNGRPSGDAFRLRPQEVGLSGSHNVQMEVGEQPLGACRRSSIVVDAPVVVTTDRQGGDAGDAYQ